jgi:hypothetical protein
MTKVTLKRESDNGVQTTGILFVEKDGQVRTFKALELPFKNNQHNISCIPEGVYKCKYTRSNRLSALKGTDFYTYEILDVPNRDGIRIHSANYASQLLGCVALGKDFRDLNNDGNVDLTDSRMAVEGFELLMNKKAFTLTILNG